MSQDAIAGMQRRGNFFDAKKDPEGALRRLLFALQREKEDIKKNRKLAVDDLGREFWRGRKTEIDLITEIVESFFPGSTKLK